VTAAVAGALVMRTDIGQQALVDQWERTATAFGRTVDDTAYARLEALSTDGPLYAIGMAVLSGPVATFVLAGVIFAFYGRGRKAVRFAQVLSVVAHAGVILALRQVIGAGSTYLRETTASITTVGLWFPMLDEALPLARFLGALDFLVLWWLAVLAGGVGVLYNRRFPTTVLTLVGAYLAAALVLALAMLASGGS
jgi:hypothetical protein